MSCLKHLFQLWVQLTSKLTGPLLWRSVFLPRQHPAGWHSSITTVALRCGFWNWIFRRPEKSNNLAANDNWVIRDDWIAFSWLLVFPKKSISICWIFGIRPTCLLVSLWHAPRESRIAVGILNCSVLCSHYFVCLLSVQISVVAEEEIVFAAKHKNNTRKTIKGRPPEVSQFKNYIRNKTKEARQGPTGWD